MAQLTYNYKDQLAHLAVRENIFASVKALKEGSEILRNLIARRQLTILGAEYSLASGLVEFFDEP